MTDLDLQVCTLLYCSFSVSLICLGPWCVCTIVEECTATIWVVCLPPFTQVPERDPQVSTEYGKQNLSDVGLRPVPRSPPEHSNNLPLSCPVLLHNPASQNSGWLLFTVGVQTNTQNKKRRTKPNTRAKLIIRGPLTRPNAGPRVPQLQPAAAHRG